MPKLQIFRAGRHTDMHGRSIEFSDADLAACAAAYDPAKFEAPLVVGHPDINAPAYGWVKSLAHAEGSPLEAVPDQVDPAFAEMVNAGRFKKISASFYMPDAPGNPSPGVWYLRHVGFLGAAAPAVKGLKNASFAADEPGVVLFADAWAMSIVAQLFRSLRDSLIARFGIDDADKALASWQIQSLEDAARAPEVEATSVQPVYSRPAGPALQGEVMTPEQIAQLQAQLAAETERANAAVAAGRQARFAAMAAADTVRIDKAVAGGRILPAHRASLIAFAAVLAAVDAQVVSFGETDETKKASAHDWFLDFVEAQPTRVDLSERAASDGAPPAADFVAPQGYTVDKDALEAHAKIVAFQKANPNTDYLTAAIAVAKGA